jgi:hypothetical protein
MTGPDSGNLNVWPIAGLAAAPGGSAKKDAQPALTRWHLPDSESDREQSIRTRIKYQKYAARI